MKVDKNEFFREAVHRICGSLEIEKAMESCFHYLKNVLPLDSIHLDHYQPDQNVFKSVASFSFDPVLSKIKVIPLPEESKEHWATEWADMEEIQIINNPEKSPEIRELCRVIGRNVDFSAIRMRLELDGRRVGALGLTVDGAGQYTEEHAEFVRALHEPFVIAMANALQHEEVLRLKEMLADDNRFLRRQLSDISGSEVIGADFGLKGVMKMVRQVAPLDSPVLLMGETGVGKGIIANVIHLASPRREESFINVNCGAIPDTLLDSELFGHEKGAFTGAISHKRGRFERADNGTIFLDEIGELPPQAQVRLLNVLQNKEIERVGGSKSIPLDIRIISATNRNLEEMMRSGRFREDLWFRLNVFPIMLPPLRQRKEDLPALVHYFVERKSKELKINDKPSLAPGALDRLMRYDWPGNVRELENLVERALIRRHDDYLTFDDLIVPDAAQNIEHEKKERNKLFTLNEMNSRHIRHALKLASGKINGPGGAAELLDIHPNTLRKRMEKLGIAYKRRVQD